MGKFVIRAVPTGFKFDLYAQNGQPVLSSEVYLTAAACRKGLLSVRKNAPAAAVWDPAGSAGSSPRNPRFEVYTDKSGGFRFRLRAKNGQIIAVSEPYAAKGSCLGGIASVKENAADAPMEEALVRTLSQSF